MSIMAYKQEPGSLIWKVVHYLKLDELIKLIKPRENGLKDGAINVPSADAEDFAETEKRIVYEVENYLKDVNDIANKKFTDIFRQAARLSLARVNDDFSDIALDAKKEIKRHTLETLPALKEALLEERKELRDLKLFKEQNNLHRLAKYPSSKYYQFGILMFAWLVESCANMFYFSAGSQLYLLGGFLQAMGISLINISVSFVVGRLAIPYMHHINRFKKALGGFFLGLWICVISVSHLLVAHYRDLLLIDPDNAMIGAWEKFYKAPLRFEAMDSWFVLILGLVVAVVAVIDGYKFDDPYPGYGKKDRDYKKKRRELLKAQEAVRKLMLDSVEDAEKKITSRLEEYDKRVKELEDLYLGASSVLDHFENIYTHVDDLVCSAVNIYREANLSVRTDPAPVSFKRMPKVKRLIEKEKYQAYLVDLKAQKDASFQKLAAIRTNAAEVRETLDGQLETLGNRMNNLAKEAEARAIEEILRENEEV